MVETKKKHEKGYYQVYNYCEGGSAYKILCPFCGHKDEGWRPHASSSNCSQCNQYLDQYEFEYWSEEAYLRSIESICCPLCKGRGDIIESDIKKMVDRMIRNK